MLTWRPVDRSLGDSGAGMARPTAWYTLRVRFPCKEIKLDIRELPASLRDRFDTQRTLSLLHVTLTDQNLKVKVGGFGMPFSNPGHPSHGWINRNEPIASGMTLTDILAQTEFRLVVAAPSGPLARHWDLSLLPPPFMYPYGTDHAWAGKDYQERLKGKTGDKFRRSWTFDNTNACITALTQSQVQDVAWLYWAADEIAELQFPAYFIAIPERKREFYVVIRLKDDFTKTFDAAWRRFQKEDLFKLLLRRTPNDPAPCEWQTRFLDYWQGIDLLANHHQIEPENDEIVIHVRQSKPEDHLQNFEPTVFDSRQEALAQGEEH